MPVITDIFGHLIDPPSGKPTAVKRFTFSTRKGLKVQVISLGAAISDVICPDKNGSSDRVVLSFDSIEPYCKFNYIGTTIGRSTNRIQNGRFKIGEQDFLLSLNNNGNHLHGGTKGWHKFNWESFCKDDEVVFSHVSPAGDEGYPGTVIAQVTYSLSEDGSLNIKFRAVTNNPTVIDMTNHSFFNLAGVASGQQGVFNTSMQIFADHYLPVSSDLIPTGEIASVENTQFDLRNRTQLKQALQGHSGFDHCYCVKTESDRTLKHMASAFHEASGRILDVYSTQPGIQFYSGNFMPKDNQVMIGKGGVPYTYQGAFCLEPQNFPNAINEPKFPHAIVYPGKPYEHDMIFKFGVKE